MQPSLFGSVAPAIPISAPDFPLTIENREAAGLVLRIWHSCHATTFGPLVVASTEKGICELHFTDASEPLITTFKKTYPNATFEERGLPVHLDAVAFISGTSLIASLPLHLFGTPFQLNVWKALLKIPSGTTLSYGALADQLQLSKTASRAVGTAVGQNPVAVLVPCHRILSGDGKLTGFRWGVERKKLLLQAEQRL